MAIFLIKSVYLVVIENIAKHGQKVVLDPLSNIAEFYPGWVDLQPYWFYLERTGGTISRELDIADLINLEIQ